jgi:FKBP-type peptidyl-prolyl cis-trans isomerase SlyD
METIKSDFAVTIKYKMKTQLPDGTIKERPEEELEFIYGVDRQASSLEEALNGADVGEKLSVTIPASEIYGEHDPTLLREIPKQGLIKQRIKKGQFYRQMKKGSLVSFKVVEIGPDTVLADFNKPMAGVSVSMDLEILAARQATKEEILAAHEAQLKRNIGCG